MSCSDGNVYQGYPINLFGVVPVSSIGYVVGIAGLGTVAVKVRSRFQVEAISLSRGYPCDILKRRVTFVIQ
jgi:hypothetical protein